MKQRFKLLKDYPNHQIGDIAIREDTRFMWEKAGNRDIPVIFFPNNAPDWWKKVEDEKTLEDYERMLGVLFSDVVPIPPEGLAFSVPFKYLELTNPQIYWTEVLKIIAQNLNKGKVVKQNNKHVILKGSDNYRVSSISIAANWQGQITFILWEDCQKAIDLLSSNIKYLFND